jgi:hypothetical protein
MNSTMPRQQMLECITVFLACQAAQRTAWQQYVVLLLFSCAPDTASVHHQQEQQLLLPRHWLSDQTKEG